MYYVIWNTSSARNPSWERWHQGCVDESNLHAVISWVQSHEESPKFLYPNRDVRVVEFSHDSTHSNWKDFDPVWEWDSTSGKVIKNCLELPEEPEGAIKVSMVKVNITRPGGRLTLSVDAKALHDTLDSIGCKVDGNTYKDRPQSRAAVVSSDYKLSPNVLLRREYPATYDLTDCFTSPPTFTQLKKMCESAYEATRLILDHYQPIDISVEIHKKAIK